MPTYEYECEKCGHHFELFQRMSEPKLTDCPQDGCDGHVKRLIGAGAGVIFKGSGFYETDYKKSAPPKSEKSGAKSTKEKSDSGSAEPEKKSGESKPSSSGGGGSDKGAS